MNKRSMWIFLDNDIIHFLRGVCYTRCISASRLAVCDEAREMTQHTETSAHRAVHRTSTKSMWISTSKTNLHQAFVVRASRCAREKNFRADSGLCL
ncbi:uncharacterized [Tachysurus ichikawai]